MSLHTQPIVIKFHTDICGHITNPSTVSDLKLIPNIN